MYRNERLAKIMEILNSKGTTTVKALTYTLGCGTATVNRDLNMLEKSGLVKRSYGYVQLEGKQTLPAFMRASLMDKEKSEIAKCAASFIKNNDTVFIDGSTTTQAIGKFLTNKENITVITNNIFLYVYLCEHNINAILLGGTPTETHYYLGGVDAECAAMKYKVDKLFFSASKITYDAIIQADEMYETLRHIMLNNSKESYFLIDKTKVKKDISKQLIDTKKIKCIISDFDFSDDVKEEYPNTDFVKV